MANSNGTAMLRKPTPITSAPGHSALGQPDLTQPKSVQFAHFGLLNDGAQSKTSMLTSITLNVAVALVIIIVGAATKKVHDDNVKLTALIAPPPIKEAEVVKPPKVKMPPPPKLPPVVKVIEPPKIKLPEIKVDVPKPAVVHMDTPKPTITPAPAVKVVAPPAPVVVSLRKPAPASVPNSDPKPSAVRLGNPDSPIKNLSGPAVAKVNLAQGFNGMPPSNTGGGPAAAKVNLGSGQPNGSAMKGPMGPVAINGLAHGTPGGTGTKAGGGPQQVALGVPPQPVAMPKPPVAASTSSPKSAIKVLFKPKPVYTAEAINLHLEGNVSVRISVSATGAITVLGISNGLGHGLDEAARNAVMGMKVQPALDASGSPVPWQGVVTVSFQLAGS